MWSSAGRYLAAMAGEPMSAPWKRYTDEVYGRLRYLASWPPGRAVAVGDIGVFNERTMERQMSMTDLGIELAVLPGREVRNQGLVSGASIKLEAGIGAKAPIHPGLRAGAIAKVSFEAENGVVLRAERSREDQLDRIDLLRAHLLELYAEGKWEEDWIVVTHVVRAEKLIVLVSEERGTGAELALSGAVELAPAALGEAEGEVTISSVSGRVFTESGSEMTPLYHAVKVQKRVLREARTKPVDKRGRALPGAGEVDVVDVSF